MKLVVSVFGAVFEFVLSAARVWLIFVVYVALCVWVQLTWKKPMDIKAWWKQLWCSHENSMSYTMSDGQRRRQCLTCYKHFAPRQTRFWSPPDLPQ